MPKVDLSNVSRAVGGLFAGMQAAKAEQRQQALLQQQFLLQQQQEQRRAQEWQAEQEYRRQQMEMARRKWDQENDPERQAALTMADALGKRAGMMVDPTELISLQGEIIRTGRLPGLRPGTPGFQYQPPADFVGPTPPTIGGFPTQIAPGPPVNPLAAALKGETLDEAADRRKAELKEKTEAQVTERARIRADAMLDAAGIRAGSQERIAGQNAYGRILIANVQAYGDTPYAQALTDQAFQGFLKQFRGGDGAGPDLPPVAPRKSLLERGMEVKEQDATTRSKAQEATAKYREEALAVQKDRNRITEQLGNKDLAFKDRKLLQDKLLDNLNREARIRTAQLAAAVDREKIRADANKPGTTESLDPRIKAKFEEQKRLGAAITELQQFLTVASEKEAAKARNQIAEFQRKMDALGAEIDEVLGGPLVTPEAKMPGYQEAAKRMTGLGGPEGSKAAGGSKAPKMIPLKNGPMRMTYQELLNRVGGDVAKANAWWRLAK